MTALVFLRVSCEFASCLYQCCSLGKIKDVLPSGVVDAMTRLVLVNAIYFKGNWNKQFKESATRDAQFRLSKVISFEKRKISFYDELVSKHMTIGTLEEVGYYCQIHVGQNFRTLFHFFVDCSWKISED